jgi:hypothetical protein
VYISFKNDDKLLSTFAMTETHVLLNIQLYVCHSIYTIRAKELNSRIQEKVCHIGACLNVDDDLQVVRISSFIHLGEGVEGQIFLLYF